MASDLLKQLADPPTREAIPVVNEGSGPNEGISRAALLVALALTFVAYCGTLAFQFVYDDQPQIVNNPWLRAWKFAPRYFATNVWGLHSPTEFGNYYRPFFLLWLRFNYLIFRLKPWGWHLTSVVAHLGVTLLVYYLAKKIVGDRLTAAVAALLFGVHPVHIESVAWVSGIPDPLMGLFFISAFLCHLKRYERPGRSWPWLALALALYFSAMLSKEVAIVLPVVIVAYEWLLRSGSGEGDTVRPRPARWRAALRAVAPYFAVIPLYLLLRAAALRGLGHAMTPLSWSTIVFTWPSLLWFYLKLLVWPLGLSPCYDNPYVTNPDLYNFFLPAAGLCGVALILAVWARRLRGGPGSASVAPDYRVIGFAAVCFLAPVLPLFDLRVLPISDVVHDRYMYLPSVGFALLAAVGLRSLVFGRARLFGQPAVQWVAVTAVAVFYVLVTVLQSPIWADDLLLYTRGMSVAPHNRNVKMNLANIACQRGLYESGAKLFQEVIAENPDFSPAFYNLGYTYYRLGNLTEADRYLAHAAELNVFSANAFLYLGLTRMKTGRLSEAVPLLRHAVQAAPDGAPIYHLALGTALKSQGDLKGALEEFQAELEIDPEEKAAREQIGEIQARSRQH